jgi:hypothetical protein
MKKVYMGNKAASTLLSNDHTYTAIVIMGIFFNDPMGHLTAS